MECVSRMLVFVMTVIIMPAFSLTALTEWGDSYNFDEKER